MKKVFWIVVLLVGFGVAGWVLRDKFPFFKGAVPQGETATKYMCPMHPQIIRDKPGVCPICGMTLQPVAEPKSDHEHQHPPSPPSGLRRDKQTDGAFLLLPERRETIGVTTAEVTKKSLQQEIRLPGRVAFDAELYATEKEYAEGLKFGAGDILTAIEKKLRRLGISAEELNELRRGKPADAALFLPQEEGGRWVYASVYESDYPFVTSGMKAIIVSSADRGALLEGVVKGVTPILDAMTRTATARIWVASPEKKLKPETTVDVTLKKDLGTALAVPASAVIDTGVKQMALVDLGEGYLEPREIKIGSKAGSDYAVVEGLEEGEQVVTSAQFLLDSESQIQSALKKFGEAPKGHQH